MGSNLSRYSYDIDAGFKHSVVARCTLSDQCCGAYIIVRCGIFQLMENDLQSTLNFKSVYRHMLDVGVYK